MIIIATFESFFWALNSEIIYKSLMGTDVGSTFTVHIFGATFGIVCSYFFYNEESLKNKDFKSSYESNLAAFLGTVFLYMYWPSFNSVYTVFGSQHRSIVCTYLSISASTVTSASISRLITGRLDVEVILNATLAGGVAIGASSDLIFQPSYALLIGILSGALSSVSYMKLAPFLKEKLRLSDTCGVLNLHLTPGLFGIICSAIAAQTADLDKLRKTIEYTKYRHWAYLSTKNSSA